MFGFVVMAGAAIGIFMVFFPSIQSLISASAPEQIVQMPYTPSNWLVVSPGGHIPFKLFKVANCWFLCGYILFLHLPK